MYEVANRQIGQEASSSKWTSIEVAYMTSLERRTRPSDALAVENAIWLSIQAGDGAAIYYMHQKGISHDVAQRVLKGPHFRRRYFDRRTARTE